MTNFKKVLAALAVVLVISLIPGMGLVGKAVAWVAEITPVETLAYDMTTSSYIYGNTSDYIYGNTSDYIYGNTSDYVYGNVGDYVYDSNVVKFNDVVEGAWYYNAVQTIVERKLFNGTGEGTFSPNASMTRAMLVTVLHRMAGSPASNFNITFKDVKKGSWYEAAVAWANENGIVNGYNAATFGTNDSVTRQDLVTILYRYAEYRGNIVTTYDNSDVSMYKDFGKTVAYAKSPFKWAIGSGLVNGTTSTTIAPNETTTRAQVATILLRYMNIYR